MGSTFPSSTVSEIRKRAISDLSGHAFQDRHSFLLFSMQLASKVYPPLVACVTRKSVIDLMQIFLDLTLLCFILMFTSVMHAKGGSTHEGHDKCSRIDVFHDLKIHATKERKSVSSLVTEFIEYGIKDKKRRTAKTKHITNDRESESRQERTQDARRV